MVNKELVSDKDIFAAIDETIKVWPDLSSTFVMELFLMKGQKLLKLF